MRGRRETAGHRHIAHAGSGEEFAFRPLESTSKQISLCRLPHAGKEYPVEVPERYACAGGEFRYREPLWQMAVKQINCPVDTAAPRFEGLFSVHGKLLFASLPLNYPLCHLFHRLAQGFIAGGDICLVGIGLFGGVFGEDAGNGLDKDTAGHNGVDVGGDDPGLGAGLYAEAAQNLGAARAGAVEEGEGVVPNVGLASWRTRFYAWDDGYDIESWFK